jgi:hypothetical protein
MRSCCSDVYGIERSCGVSAIADSGLPVGAYRAPESLRSCQITLSRSVQAQRTFSSVPFDDVDPRPDTAFTPLQPQLHSILLQIVPSQGDETRKMLDT